MLRLARREPESLFLGVDTHAAGLVTASRLAAQPARKAGLSNAVFVVADATDVLEALAGRIDEVRIVLPWSALLRRVLEGEERFALAVAGAL